MDIKVLNRMHYSKKVKKRKKKGKRPHSPWYYLIGKIERVYFDKHFIDEDFTLLDFAPIKAKTKFWK